MKTTYFAQQYKALLSSTIDAAPGRWESTRAILCSPYARLANGYAVTLAVVNDTCSRSPMDLGEALHRSKCDGVEL